MSQLHLEPRECEELLHRLCDRNTAMEISIHDGEEEETGRPPKWHRVRLLSVAGHHLLVERPAATVHPRPIRPGTPIYGLLVDGEKRWQFQSAVQDRTRYAINATTMVNALQLRWPERVYSGQRRSFYRVDVAGLKVGPARVSILADTESCEAAELHNQSMHARKGAVIDLETDPPMRPNVGGTYGGTMENLSAGGACLRADRALIDLIQPDQPLWLELDLSPDLGYPLCMVCRPVYYEVIDDHAVHLGVRFDYEHHRAHEEFVVEKLCRVTAAQQRRLLQRAALRA